MLPIENNRLCAVVVTDVGHFLQRYVANFYGIMTINLRLKMTLVGHPAWKGILAFVEYGVTMPFEMAKDGSRVDLKVSRCLCSIEII